MNKSLDCFLCYFPKFTYYLPNFFQNETLCRFVVDILNNQIIEINNNACKEKRPEIIIY
jgi:hypothetical protein